MNEERLEERVDDVRRKLLKTSAVVGGTMVLGHLTYQKPAWKSFFGVRSAWAQPTSFLQHQFQGQLGTSAPGTMEDTGQDCFEFTSADNNQLSINVSPDMNLDIEIYLYGPGAVGQNQPNLLNANQNPFGLNASQMAGGAESAVVTTPTTGTYTLCIEDARSPNQRVAGLYTGTITSTKPMGPLTAVVDEGPQSDGPE